MTPPPITVAIPAFNAMPWLPECIDSLLNQDTDDFEVLVVDDGSTDQSREYLASINDRRFKIIHQEHRGLTATLNRMLVEVKSPWMMRQDADDIALPHRVAKSLEFIRQYPNSGLLYSHALHFQGGRTFGPLRTTVGNPAELRQLVMSGYLPAICHSAIVLNVSRARQIGGYILEQVEEYDMYWRMALASEVRLIPEPLVGYRIRAGSVCTLRDSYEWEATVLFVQYQLLSVLNGIESRSFEEVKDVLLELVDRRECRYRATLRNAMAFVGSRQFGLALTNAGKALAASPKLFALRVLHQFGHRQLVHVGVSPKRFFGRSDELWPEILLPATFGSMQPESVQVK